MFVLFFMIFGLILLLYFLTLPFSYWKNKNVPYPPVSYIFGNVREAILLKKSIQEVYDDLYRKYDKYPYIGFFKNRTPSILLRNLNVIKDVLVKNFNSFSDNDVSSDEKLDPLFSKNPFMCKGHRWKESRGQLAPSFTAKHVKEMFPLMNGVAKNLVEYIATKLVGRNDGVEAKELFVMYTTDVVTSCALGLEANCFVNPDSDYIKMYNTMFAPSFFGKIRLLFIFNIPILAKLFKLRFVPKVVDKYYRNIINDTLQYRNKHNVERGDFLDSMNRLKEKTLDFSFSDDDMCGHVLSFIIEGTETSSIVLSFTLYEIALDLKIQKKLQMEIDEMAKTSSHLFSFDVINKMELLDQIINESMRKNTVASRIRRVCTQQFSLETPSGSGQKVLIEPGTPVIIPIHSIHHDPAYYPDPYVFDPSRFTTENKEKRPNYTFMPFGEGPRMCLGMRFGYAQIKIALVHIIANFEVRINKKTTVPYIIDPHYFLLSAKRGIWLDFYKRQLI